MNDEYFNTHCWVSFYLKNNGDEYEDSPVINLYHTAYPTYRPGDIIWLEINVLSDKFDSSKALPLTKYRIVNIQHSIRRTMSEYIRDIVSLEVIIEPIETYYNQSL